MNIRHRIMPLTRGAALALTLAGASTGAFAQTTTPGDLARVMTPDWCEAAVSGRLRADQDKDQAIRAKLYGLEKSGCRGYQRYCSALVTSGRALLFEGETPETQRAQLMAAAGDYGYVLANSRKECSLLPDTYTKLGEIQTRLGQFKEGEESFAKAIKIKGGHAPAFVGLSDLYENQGNIDKAIAALQAGLKANPTSTMLKKKLQRVQARKTEPAAAP